MPGRVSSVREALAGGGRVRGTFVKLPALEVVDVIARSLDFLVVDLEHSQLSEADALSLVRHAHTVDFPALVRLPAVDPGLVNRLLEAGAAGIQLSTVTRAAEIEALRAACEYAPRGRRSISLAHPLAGYGAVPLGEYLEAVLRPLVIAQIETLQTADPLDALIAAAPDAVFIGVTDLTVDAQLDTERVRARVDEIVAAAGGAGVPVGGFGDDERFAYAVVSSDVALLQEALSRV
jgi:4-hydroxy-2-oxoheptanedioate aldolase